MDILRTILIVLGVLLVIGIYLFDRLKRRRSKEKREWGDIDSDVDGAMEGLSSREETLPDEWVGKAVTITAKRNERLDEAQLERLKGLGGHDGDEAPVIAPQKATPEIAQADAPLPPEEVIVLSVMAGEGRRFRGPLLLKVLQEAGLKHGEMGIFHFHPDDSKTPLFSVANVLEPGRFELKEIASLETPGLALFMQLPAPLDGEQAMNTLLQRARQMAAQLGGSLCDAQRRPLDQSAIAALQNKAKPYTAIPS